MAEESEARTRKRRVDPRLAAAGWKVVRYDEGAPLGRFDRCAIAEYPTASGPADYALCVGGQVLGIVEAKRLTLGPQNVLTQAERYARGVAGSPFDFRGLRVPFLYSTNGEVIWHHDVRGEISRSYQLAGFHTPEALEERLDRDFETACGALAALPNRHERLRSYQREANAAVEKAIAGQKRQMLLAMATGTGKIAISLAISLGAAVLTFTSETLLGTLAGFQRAWNSGRLDRVEACFDPDKRESLCRQFRQLMKDLEAGASEGQTDFRVALVAASVADKAQTCRATYSCAPRGRDPFRSEGRNLGRLQVWLVKRGGRWCVQGMSIHGVRDTDAPKAGQAADPAAGPAG